MSARQQFRPRPFKFPLPFDPLRIIYGIREKWHWFLTLPILGMVLGYAMGHALSQDRYSVSLQLIKSPVPNSLQTSETGQPYRVRDLSDDTLLATTYSTEVLARTGQRLQPERSSGAVKSMVGIAKQRNTDLFYLTAHSRKSKEEAIQTVKIWAEEIIRFTNNLQKEEALSVQRFINSQLQSIDRQLETLDARILKFSNETKLISPEAQTESAVIALDALQLRLLETSSALEAKEAQIERYREELRSQSPLEADLKRKREELVFLRGRYTDNNPLVEEKLYEINYIEQQIADALSASSNDLDSFTGSDLGNNLYLEILAFESERTQLIKEKKELEELLEIKTEEVSGMPRKALALRDMLRKREQLIVAQEMLNSRQKEASFYASNTPGYWRIFQEPNLREVAASSEKAKAVMLAGLGSIFGVGLALVMAALWELVQPGLRTPLETAIATRSMPSLLQVIEESDRKSSFWSRVLFNNRETAQNETALNSFWLTEMNSHDSSKQPRFLFITIGDIELEMQLWRPLLQRANEDQQKLGLIDLSQDHRLDQLRNHPGLHQLGHDITDISEDKGIDPLIIRLNREPRPAEIQPLGKVDCYFLLVSPSKTNRDSAVSRAQLVEQLWGPPRGLIILEQAKGRAIPRLIRWFELALISKLDPAARFQEAKEA